MTKRWGRRFPPLIYEDNLDSTIIRVFECAHEAMNQVLTLTKKQKHYDNLYSNSTI